MLKFLNGVSGFCFEEAGAEGSGAGGEGNQPAGGGDGGQQGNEGGEGNQPQLYRPEGLADHLLGENDQATIDKLFTAYDGARKELSKKSGVPEKFDDYKIELGEELAGKVLAPGEDGKDPVFEKIRAAMHKNGIPADKALDVITAFYGEVAPLIEAAQAEAAEGGDGVALDFEFKGFGGAEKAKPVIAANEAFIRGLQNQGVIDEKDAADMRSNLRVGEGLAWMDKIRVHLAGGAPIPADMSGKAEGGEVTKAELDRRVSDPRYQAGNPKFDPAFHEETTKMFQQLYNGA